MPYFADQNIGRERGVDATDSRLRVSSKERFSLSYRHTEHSCDPKIRYFVALLNIRVTMTHASSQTACQPSIRPLLNIHILCPTLTETLLSHSHDFSALIDGFSARWNIQGKATESRNIIFANIALAVLSLGSFQSWLGFDFIKSSPQ